MTSSSPLVQVRSLRVPGLEPTDLEVAAGECVAIQGPSGSGKTLLLRAVADLDPAGGDVIVGGVPRSAVAGPDWRRRVAYVAAESGWWADRVGDHFDDWTALIADTAALGLPADCDQWRVERLSTGERQRLALLRALERQPRVLLLDEPTSGLDADSTSSAEALIQTRRVQGAAVLWVTHDTAQAGRVATRHMTVASGRIAGAP